MSTDNKFIRSLLQNAQLGNNAAVEQLFQMNLSKVYALVLRLTSSKVLAEKITKDTFIEAWRKLNSIRPDSSFLGWLNAITTYKTLDELRKRKEEDKQVKSDLKEILSSDDLENAIYTLPETERIAFVLNFVEKYSVEETGDLMGLRPEKVRFHIDLATEKLLQKTHIVKNIDDIRNKVKNLPADINPAPSVKEGIFSYILEEKLKEVKEPEPKVAEEEEMEEEEPKKKSKKKEAEEYEETVIDNVRDKISLDASKLKWIGIAAGAIMVLAALFFFFVNSSIDWTIVDYTGEPTQNNSKVSRSDLFSPDNKIVTDEFSTVIVSVPKVGKLYIDKSTSVTRLNVSNSILLNSGKITKTEEGAEDIFSVQTPLCTIKDLNKGGIFTVEVQENDLTSLAVNSGWCVVAVKGFESYVPKDYFCQVSKGHFAIPYSDKTKPDLVDLILGYSGASDPSITSILDLVSADDALTLWHVLQMCSVENRILVYDKLASLIPPPATVTKEGIANMNNRMLKDWLEEIELNLFVDSHFFGR